VKAAERPPQARQVTPRVVRSTGPLYGRSGSARDPPPDAAPATMVKLYGSGNGFGWKLQNAQRAFYTFMGSLVAVFAVVFVALNVMLSWMIVRPVARLSRAADQVSTGNFEIPEFPERGRDEIALLGRAFNRMRRSLQKAMQMIES
jgi:HAMP domain-containing protein